MPPVVSLWTFCLCAGERHGTPAERLLAAQRRLNQAALSRPHTLFATGPKQQPQHIPEGGQQGAAGEQHVTRVGRHMHLCNILECDSGLLKAS